MSQPHATPLPAPAAPDPAGGSLREYFASLRNYPRRAWMAISAGIIAMIMGPAVINTLTTFVLTPVSQDFGWSQSQTVLLMSSLPLMTAPFVLTFGGYLADRMSMRRAAIGATVLYAVAMCLMMVVAASALQLGVLAVVAISASSIGAQVVAFKTVAVWFPRHRGAGFALVSAASSLASAAFSPLFQQATDSLGWRSTYLVVGVCVLVLCVPAQIFLLSEPDAAPSAPGARAARESAPAETRNGPAETAETPAVRQGHPDDPGVPMGAAIRSRTWLLLMLVILVPSGITATMRTIGVDLFGDRGYTSETVSLALSVFWLASFVGQCIAGPMMDRSKSARAAIPFVGCVLLGTLIVATTQGTVWLLFVALGLMGAFQGAEYTIAPYLLGRYFGNRSFAQLLGLTLGITSVVSFAGIPYLAQMAGEQAGTYDGVLLVMLVAVVIVTAAAFVMPRYPEPGTAPAKELAEDRNVPESAPDRASHT